MNYKQLVNTITGNPATEDEIVQYMRDIIVIGNEILGAYRVDRYCLNCGASTRSVHTYGTEASETAVCSNCGCNKAIRS